MNAHNKLILLILATTCTGHSSQPKQDILNVGTVLFTAADIKKTHWHKSELALLQARLHFQKLLPPLNGIDLTKDYIDKMLSYFRDAYVAIKRETNNDPTLDSIMTTALSDTLGGFLKMWVLPITKLAFYGGVVSYDSATKLFDFYDELKKYLATDGSGWRAPDDKILNSISASVPRQERLLFTQTRCSEDPCDHFSYFERTLNGFTIPLPTVNWADSTMFVPIKNGSFISLNSPKYYNTLLKYYTDAKHCLEKRNANASQKFEEKFQMWISKDVVPHLTDESLYVALGSVLSLVDMNRYLYDSTNENTQGALSYIFTKLTDTKLCIQRCSKKVWLISVILLIELIWCVFALKYTCLKSKSRKKNMSVCDSLTLYFKEFRNQSESRKTTQSTSCDDITADSRSIQENSICSYKQYYGSYSNIIGGGIKLQKNPKSKQHELAIQVPSKETELTHTSTAVDARSHTSISSKISSNEVVTIINEIHPQIQKNISSSRTRCQKVVASILSNKSSEVTTAGFIHKCNCHSSHDNPTGQDETITLFRKSHAMFDSTENTTQLETSVSESSKHTPIDILTLVASEPASGGAGCGYGSGKTEVCMCPFNCTETTPDSGVGVSHNNDYTCMTFEPRAIFGMDQETETVTQTQPAVLMCVKQETQTTVEEHALLQTIGLNNDYVFKKKETKRSIRHPYLEIKIEQPNAEIKLGISGVVKLSNSPRKGLQRHISNAKAQKEPNEFFYTEDYLSSRIQSHCDQIDHDQNVLFTGSILHEKPTKDKSAEVAPILIDNDTDTIYKYKEQAAGSFTILPNIERSANTSRRYVGSLLQREYISNPVDTDKLVNADAPIIRLLSAPARILKDKPKHKFDLEPSYVSFPSDHSQNTVTKEKNAQNRGESKYNLKPPQCTGTQGDKVKKITPGVMPKYLRDSREEETKQRKQDKSQTDYEIRPEADKFQSQGAKKHGSSRTSSPIRRSLSCLIKSAGNPISRSASFSIKDKTISQYTNKRADTLSRNNTDISTHKVRTKQETTSGIPTKTKIPISPRNYRQITKIKQVTQPIDGAIQNEQTTKKEDVELKRKSPESVKSTQKILDHATATVNNKPAPKSALKYSKRYASSRKPGGELTLKVEDKSPGENFSDRVPEVVTEAQKVISDIIKQSEVLPDKKKHSKYRSYIPRLKRAAADDCDLQKKKAIENRKLNVTL